MDKLKPIIKNHFLELKTQRGVIKCKKVGLVLFLPDSGISALMKKADLQEQRTVIDDTNELNSWFNENISLSSVPDLLHDKKSHANFVKTILKTHDHKTLDLITVCLDIHRVSLMSPKGLITELHKFRKVIQCLCSKLPNKPNLFITFTQLDKIAGFSHSFSGGDLTKSWGYTFSTYLNEASLIKQQNEHLTTLIEGLHNTLIERLHRTTDKLASYLIREFPLQMESLSNMIRACVKHLSQEDTQTAGVFFTSAKQGNHANDRLSKHISQAFALNPIDKIPQSSIDKAFFIKGWLNAISSNYSTSAPKTPYAYNLKPYLVSGSVSLVLSTLAIGLYVHHSKEQLANVHKHLVNSNVNLSNDQDITQTLENLHLASLYAEKTINPTSFSKVKSYALNAQDSYKKGLNELLLPNFRTRVESILQQKPNLQKTYGALKAYIMLVDPRVTDRDYLLSWYKENWAPQLKKHQQEKIFKLLTDAFKDPYQGIEVNQNLLNSTKNFLAALPQDYLLFNITLPNLDQKITPLKVPHFTTPIAGIPALYTREAFQKNYLVMLPDLAKKIAEDSYVLGVGDTIEITKSLQSQYLKAYQSFWQNYVKNIKPIPFKSFDKGHEFFISLSERNSSLIELLSFVQSQTIAFPSAKSEAEQAFNQTVAQPFSTLQLVTPYQLQLLRTEFKNLATYFMTFLQQQDSGQSVFQFARQRFTHLNATDPLSRLYELSSELPEPFASWVNDANENAWFLVLLKTEQYINEAWNQHIYQLYHLKIKDKFPFNEQSSTQITLSEFNDFFAPSGVLTQFFNTYLSPFIDTTQANWQMKSLNHLQLPISEDSLHELIRANVIKEIFYPNNIADPSVQFSLHAVALDPVIQSLELDINAQVLKDFDHQQVSKEFLWPNADAGSKTSLSITKISGEIINLTEEGDWGLFKLIQQANLTPLENDSQNYELILDLNGNSAKFLLSAKSPLNPFVPKLLSSFHLPHQLS